MNLKSLIAAFAVAATSVASPLAAKELTMASSAPEGSLYGDRLQDIADNVAKLSGGELTIKVFFSSALGDEQTVIRQAVRGRVDIAAVSASAASLVTPEVGVLLEPYLFADDEQARCVMSDHMKGIYSDRFGRDGLVALGYVGLGSGGTFAENAIVSPDQLEGLKFRVSPTPPVINYYRDLDASTVSAGVTDMIPMLKTKAIDGADTLMIYGAVIGLHKIVPQVVVSGAFTWSGVDLLSQKTWDKLSEQERGWLIEGTKMAEMKFNKVVVGAEQAIVKKIGAEGGTVTYLTAEQQAPFRQVAEDGRKEAIAAHGEAGMEIWTALQGAISNCAQ